MTPYSHVYVFRDQGGQVKQVLSQELGPELLQFIVGDINRDGNTEVMITTGENAVESMNIWQIDKKGELKKIQRIDGYRVHTNMDRYMVEGAHILVEHKIGTSVGGQACFRISEYTWSAKNEKLVKVP